MVEAGGDDEEGGVLGKSWSPGCGGAITAPRRTQPAIGPLQVVRPTCAPNAGSTRLHVW